MNYVKLHDEIIARARRRPALTCYFELHHVTPKSHGGSDKKSNMVALTAREHFLIHWLLKKIHKDPSMIYAFFAMTRLGNSSQKRYTSHSFKYAREGMAVFLSENRSGDGHPLFGVKGDKNPNFGSKRSEESKRKISEKAMGRPSSQKVRIACVETGEVFESISEAKIIFKGNVSYALRTGGTADGKHFNYIDKDGNQIIKPKTLVGYAAGERHGGSKRIKNLSTGEVFGSAGEAARSIGVSVPAISWGIKNNKPTKGIKFNYV